MSATVAPASGSVTTPEASIAKASLWTLGRVYCHTCNRIAKVVKAPDAEVRCPRCESVCEPASGDEKR